MKNKEQHIFPFLERLLDGAEVEWKKLGEVCDFKNGFAFKSNLFKEKGLPIIRISNITGTSVDVSDVKYFDIQDYHKNSNPLDYSIDKGDVLIAMSGATTAKIGYYDKEEKAYQNQRVGKFIPQKNILNSRFLYHFLQTRTQYIYNLAGGGAQPNLSSNDIKEKIIIPVPSISVQEEIVRILDKFTTLEAGLEAELDCRKRQYEYYRNQLLSFDMLNKGEQRLNDVSIIALGDLGEFVRGSGLPKKDFTSTGVGCIHYGQIYTYYGTSTDKTLSFVSPETASRLKHVDYGDVIVTNTSENIEDVCKAVAYMGKESIVIGGHACIFKPSDKIIGKYFAYYTQTVRFASDKRKYAKGTKVIDVSANDLSKIQIPVPSLTEQHRIVSILDKFDTLVNSISEGLPKEIELRRKQYEYYRERLLSFRH